jgi:hypothetical protein
MRLLVFNPENDMALASGLSGYTAPETIERYSRSQWMLPRLWAGEDDLVWDWKQDLTDKDITEVVPWGWSKALMYRLSKAGVRREVMPSDAMLDGLRTLSSRVFTSKLQRELGLDVAVCKTWEEVEIFERCVGPAVMKAPWSSSGKGLMMVSSPTARGWMQNTVAREGAVVCERWMNRVQDFALEFTVEESGAVRYEGLSVFRTSPTGRYVAHDFVTPEDQRAALMQWVSEEEVQRWRKWWQKRLEEDDIRAFSYAGPMGVDMLVDADGRINPCVELNWRMTMGHVALLRGKNEQK